MADSRIRPVFAAIVGVTGEHAETRAHGCSFRIVTEEWAHVVYGEAAILLK